LALILHIETSTKTCSVSLAESGNLLSVKTSSSEEYNHTEELYAFIEEIYSAAGRKIKDTQAVCVGSGPGSYTGLRIGASAAKGICFALGIPLISVETTYLLAVKAQELHPTADLYVPMIDARRMEVYTAAFDSKLNLVSAVSAMVLDKNSFSDNTKKMVFCGDGCEKFKPLFKGSNAVFADTVVPDASTMCVPAFKKFTQKAFEDVAYFEPNYLKPFVSSSAFHK
jgi:tRNA threonylcarbamoyladenosine biosynthesis protein TsaB